jgi:hypothetical protein
MSAGQKKPALHCALLLAVLPVARQKPAAHGVHLAAPAALKKPTLHTRAGSDAVVVPDGQYEPGGHGVQLVALPGE